MAKSLEAGQDCVNRSSYLNHQRISSDTSFLYGERDLSDSFSDTGEGVGDMTIAIATKGKRAEEMCEGAGRD